YVVAAATMGYALLLLLRPVLVRRPSSTAERERARRIVEGWGCSSLARLALLPDKSFLFSEGGSVVAYVAKGRAAVALGDPIGPPQDALPAITAFRDLCWQSDWNAAFYQTLPELLPAYQEAGFHALRIGAEAIVDLEHFSLEGKDGKAFRNAQHRLTRLGHRVGTFDPPIAPEVMEELRAVSDEWLTLVHGTEKRFSLGWFDEDYVASSQILAVLAADGAVTAFANLLPEYRRNETSVDLMRHRREAPPGTMDFLFLALFEWSKAHGFATFNLGLSSLSGVGEHPQDPGLERALHFSVEHIRRFYDFKGLFEYKAKFNPSWSPRFLIYPSAAALPSILACLARADSGDDGWLGILRR
ncbi:MAG TPA: phosphatidylglycerol lysyltransferase domain-containing protein, partial [Anaerolineales bacterium]|nr:phosphatidylglycerol lysyltransferase domain-containing protein [Anaerolineales bacterium]